MGSTPLRNKENLTGRFSFRETWSGKMILRVEFRRPAYSPGEFWTEWRDAESDDVAILRDMGKLQ